MIEIQQQQHSENTRTGIPHQALSLVQLGEGGVLRLFGG
jgi:hypothetical protein